MYLISLFFLVNLIFLTNDVSVIFYISFPISSKLFAIPFCVLFEFCLDFSVGLQAWVYF